MTEHVAQSVCSSRASCQYITPAVKDRLECEPMPNVMAALPNIGGTLCSTLQSLADTHYQSAVQ